MRPKFFEIADPRIGGILAAELDENPQLATVGTENLIRI